MTMCLNRCNTFDYSGKVKHELRVQIHELRVRIHELRARVHVLEDELED